MSFSRVITHLFSWVGVMVLTVAFALTNVMAEQTGGDENAEKGQRNSWQSLIGAGDDSSEGDILRRVNEFVNRNIDLASEVCQSELSRYTAIPMGGSALEKADCKNYAIAKYFALLALGLDKNKIRITYTKASKSNQPHIVLTYFSSLKAPPLVLDNLTAKIKSAGQRQDLLPVYSFKDCVWLSKAANYFDNMTASRVPPSLT